MFVILQKVLLITLIIKLLNYSHYEKRTNKRKVTYIYKYG